MLRGGPERITSFQNYLTYYGHKLCTICYMNQFKKTIVYDLKHNRGYWGAVIPSYILD